jgi:hypothetical protein
MRGVQDAVLTRLQENLHSKFMRGSGEANFGRLALEGGPPAGGDTPMTKILSIEGLGDMLMFCYTDATPTTAGGFAFLNTSSQPLLVSGFGTLQPGDRINEGSMGSSTTFLVTSGFDHPDRIATITVGDTVVGNVCLGHVHAVAQP